MLVDTENRYEKDNDCSYSPGVFGYVYVGDVVSCCLNDVAVSQ